MPDEPEQQQPVEQEQPEAQPEEELRPIEDVLRDLERHHETNPEVVKLLRSNKVVSGLAGQIADTLAASRMKALDQQTRADAARQKQEELLRLAEDDPEAFAAQFRTEAQAKRAEQELQGIRFAERKALAEQISRATGQLEEWKDLSPTEQSRVAKALIGVPEDQVFAAYQVAVIDVVADKRTARKLESAVAERVKAEKEAWQEEQAAKRVKTTAAPSLRAGRLAGDSDEPDFRDTRAWNEWYEKKHGLRKVGT